MTTSPPFVVAANACVRVHNQLPSKGPLPSAHEPSAKKLRTFFSSKKDVTAEQFKKVTCFGDLHEHTGITAEDAKAAMVADDEAPPKEKDYVDDEEKSVTTEERCWTKVATKTTVRGGEPSIETLTKFESKMMYFEVLKDLPEDIVAEMDVVFMKIEEAYKDAAEPPTKRRKVEKPSKEEKKITGKKKAKKDKEEKKENKEEEKENTEEMKAKLAELLETAKALQERMEALQ